MDVLVVSDWYPQGSSLAGTFVRDQARAVAQAPARVAVVHLGAAPPTRLLPAVEQDADLETPGSLLRVRRPRLPASVTLANALGLRRAAAQLRDEGFVPAVVHAHELGAAFAAGPIARGLGAPLVVSEHFSGWALGTVDVRTRRLARRAAARAALLAPVSGILADALAAAGVVAPAVEVVPNPIDETLMTPSAETLRRSGPAERAVAVASLVPVKGIDVLIEAWSRLPGELRSLRLDVIGDGPQHSALQVAIQQSRLGDRVRLLGARPRAEVAEALRDADFVVVPSRFETFSLVAAEALACGQPVVASDVGALPERVPADGGVLVAAGDSEALATGIADVARRCRAFDRESLSRNAVAELRSAAIGARWIAIYERLLAR